MIVSRKMLFPEKHHLIRTQEMYTSLRERQQTAFTLHDFLQVTICAMVWKVTRNACGVNAKVLLWL